MQSSDENKSINFMAIWSKCIDIQMHFNSINLTIKSLAITGFTFFIAGLGYLYKEKVYLEKINVLMWFSLMGALIIILFYFIDRYWYHIFLKATSAHITVLEKTNRLDSTLCEALKISEKIGIESKKPIWGVFVLNSEKKTDIFYSILFIPFIIISLYAFVEHDKQDDNDKILILEQRINELTEDISKLKPLDTVETSITEVSGQCTSSN